MPSWYWSAGQKREESGVSTSSIRCSVPRVEAELELGVGDDDAARQRVGGRLAVEAQRGVAHLRRQCGAEHLFDRGEVDVLVVRPIAALVDGVKIGCGSCCACFRPGGRAMPQTAPVSW